MKSILLHIKNSILLQSIELALKKTNDFRVDIEKSVDINQIVENCKKYSYDILFMDITRSYLYGLEERKKIIFKIKERQINTKIVIFCDSNSEPEIASEVRDLKSLNLIDAFFYETVNDKYMVAILESL